VRDLVWMSQLKCVDVLMMRAQVLYLLERNTTGDGLFMRLSNNLNEKEHTTDSITATRKEAISSI